MVPLVRRFILRDRGRQLVTIFAVGVSVALTLFLLAVYEGVKDGSTRYVRTADVDFWVCQQNANNLLKSSSFLRASLAHDLAAVNGVAGAGPLSRIITKATVGGRKSSTLFLLAFDSESGIGAPATIRGGSARLKPHEILIDHSFASKYRLETGSSLSLQDIEYRVAGISEGTNALVSQFGFIRFDDGSRLLGLPGITSFILVRALPGRDLQQIARDLRAAAPDAAVFSRNEFVANNLQEMQTGILPVFITIASFGGLVCALIVALMLYSSILERREDYATLKALGAPHRLLLRLVVGQSLVGSISGFLVGALLSSICTPALLYFVPALTLDFTVADASIVFGGCVLVGLIGATVPVQLLRRIYPAEVFRA